MAKSYASKNINEEPIFLTPAGIERMRERYERLKKRLPALAEETARTAAYGDRSDNAEYKQAKGALRYTQHEVYRLEDQLKRAVAIPAGKNAEGTVQLGSVVVLAATDGVGAQKTYEILGPDETDPAKGRISSQSPLGAALMNHVVGDIVTVKTANGSREYRIAEIK